MAKQNEEEMTPGKYRFIIALLLFIAGAINYMDRAAIGVVAPLLNKDFVLSPSALGATFSIFFIGYAIFAFVGGQLADRYGPRRVYTWAAITDAVLARPISLASYPVAKRADHCLAISALAR